MHGISVYVTRPAGDITPKGVVVFISVAFGWKFRVKKMGAVPLS